MQISPWFPYETKIGAWTSNASPDKFYLIFFLNNTQSKKKRDNLIPFFSNIINESNDNVKCIKTDLVTVQT